MESTSASPGSLFALADACVACGLCLPHCPTYKDARQEAESPRGRIMIARALGSGKLSAAEAAEGAAIDHCLGCRACEAVCPAKVRYGDLLPALRATLRASRPAGWQQRWVERLLARPHWLRSALHAAALLRRVPGLRRHIPRLPRMHPLPVAVPTLPARGHVLLLQGCVGTRLERPAHAAALRLLGRLGWRVSLGPAYACCGSLHSHGGAPEAAAALQASLRKRVEAVQPDHVLSASSGCIEALRRACGATPVHELTDFLDRSPGWDTLRLRQTVLRVGLHVPCTQRNVLRREDSARALLARIPGITLTAAPDSGCCGAAGIQRLLFPGQAARRVAPLRDWARAQPLDVLCSANVGCRIHLELALADGTLLPTRHPLELLDAHLA